MGLGDADPFDGGDGGGGKLAASAISCSICLELVTDKGDRSWAKLQCGHQFHLDCIGSAFNAKGAMQCPNCRTVEKGLWLFANGGRPLNEFNIDDWLHDEDLYDLSYSEMSFGVHWCPFSGLTRLPSSVDEGEFSASAYHDFLGHHAILAEHAHVPSTNHHCPYIAYFGPIHPSSSVTSGNASDGSSFNNQWSGPSVSNEVPSSYGYPSLDVHYHGWGHSFAANNRMGGADQSSIPSVTQRISRDSSDIPRSGMQPFFVGQSSASGVPDSVTSSVIPPFSGTVGRPRDRAPSRQAYFQPSASTSATRAPVISTRRRSSSRSLAQPIAPSSVPSGGFYFSSSSSGRTFQEAENPHRERFHSWEWDHQPSFQADRDSIWGPIHRPTGRLDNGMRSFWQWHGSERMPPSQNRS